MTTPAAPHTLAQLLTPQTLADLRGQLLAFLQAQGFPALTEWSGEPTGLEMSWVDLVCKSINDLAQSNAPVDQQIASAAAARFLGYAKGGWLDILAWEVYRLKRDQATKTSFTLTLVSLRTSPPYTFEVGDVRVVGPTGNQYVSTTAGSLEPGGQVEVSFQAQNFGSGYDDDPTLVTPPLQLATSYAGVSISTAVGDFTVVANTGGSTGILTPVRTNPSVTPVPHGFAVQIETAGDPGTATYTLSVDGEPFAFGLLNASNVLPDGTTVNAALGSSPSFLAGDTFVFSTPGSSDYIQGDDLESDAALAQRCRGRWPSLALNTLDGTVVLWTVTALPSANRVSVGPDRVTPGRFVVTVADSHGGVNQAGLNRIVSYITPRLGVGEGMSAVAASNAPVTVGGNVRVPRGTSAQGMAAIQAAAQTAWEAYLASVPIGPSEIFISTVIQILMDAGCEDCGDVLAIGVVPTLIPAGTVPISGELLVNSLAWLGA